MVVKNSSKIGQWFGSWIDYPVLLTVLAASLTLLAIGGYVRPTWPVEFYRNWLEPKVENVDLEAVQAEPPAPPPKSARVARTSLGHADAFMVVESPSFFTPRGAAAIREVVRALEEMESVSTVMWLDQAPPLNIFGLSEPILPSENASQQRFDYARERAVQHPLIVGQLLSPDAQTMLLMVNFQWMDIFEDEDCTTAIIQTAEKAAAKYPDIEMKFSVTGPVPIRMALIRNQEENQLKYQIIGYSMVLLMSAILFRGLSVVFVVAMAPALGVFWTLGLLRYFDLQDNPFSDVILPVLLSLVGFADSVHMIIDVRKGLVEGLPAQQACRYSLSSVGLACFLTCITTSIGMGSLAFAKHEIVQEFGLSCVLGAFATWLAVMLVVPLVCRTRWSRRLAAGAERDFIDQQLHRAAAVVAWSLRHAKPVSFFAIALLIVMSGIALTLKPDDRKTSSLPAGGAEQRSLAHLDKAMGGLDVCRVHLAWRHDAVTKEEIAKVIQSIDDILDREPLIGHPLSLCNLLKALPGDQDPIQKMSMADLLPPPLKLAFYAPESKSATITFRVQDLGTMAYEEVFIRIETALDALMAANPDFFYSLDGDPIRRWKNLYQIVEDLARSLGSAAIEIFIILGIVFRSIRMGIISVIPNVLPLAAAATWMAFTKQPLEIVSVCAFTVCWGIAVDDTIHFYRVIDWRCKSIPIAMRPSFALSMALDRV